MSSKIGSTIAWVAVIVWMAVIFSLSNQPANESDRLSNFVTHGILKAAENSGITKPINTPAQETQKVKQYDSNVRDAAHATVYLVLGFLIALALKTSGFKGFNAFAYAYLICMVYAWSDETHQIFVTGRGATYIDLSLDFTGSLLGILILYLVAKAFTLVRHLVTLSYKDEKST